MLRYLIYILILGNIILFVYSAMHREKQYIKVDITKEAKEPKPMINEVPFPVSIISHHNTENKNTEILRAFIEENDVDGFIMPKQENLTSRFVTIMPILVFLEIEGINIKYHERMDNRYLRNVSHETLSRITK